MSSPQPDAGRAVDVGLAALVRRLDTTQLVRRIVVAMTEQVPALRHAPDALVTEVERAVQESVEAGMGRLLDGGDDQNLSGLHERYVAVARRRALQHVPMELSLLGYEVAASVLLSEVVERVGSDPGAVPLLASASRWILDHLSVASRAIVQGYQAAADGDAAEDESRVQRYLEVLAGRSLDTRPEAALLPLRLTRPFRWCAVSAALDPRAVSELETRRRRWGDVLVGWLDDRLVILSAADCDTGWLQVPFGTADVESFDVAAAVRRATAAADVASHLRLPSATFTRVGVLHGLLDVHPADREAFLRATLGDLLDPAHADLLLTLRSYLEHAMSATAAARALHVHRHTLDYRLRRVAELSGQDVRDSGTRFLLDIALFLLPAA